MSGDLSVEVKVADKLYVVHYEEASDDEPADDVRCPNCDSRRVVEHKIVLTEVEITDDITTEVIEPTGKLGRAILSEASVLANAGREQPYTCDDCQHNFH